MEPRPRLTCPEGGARLAAAAVSRNTIATEYAPFIATTLVLERAYQTRGRLSSGYKRSVYVTRESRVPVVAHELALLTDLRVIVCQSQIDGMWETELEDNQVVVCTSSVLSRLLTDRLLDMSNINVLVIDSCHLIHRDPYLKCIMHHYKLCEEDERPRVLALTYPLFQSSKKETDTTEQNCENQAKIDENPTICDQIDSENIETEENSPKIIDITESEPKDNIELNNKSIDKTDSEVNKATIDNDNLAIDETESKSIDDKRQEEKCESKDFMDNIESKSLDNKEIEGKSDENAYGLQNLDDFELYEKLEWKIEQLEEEICCQMDLAEDIDGGKRFSGIVSKPKELIIEYSQPPPLEQSPDLYVDLDKYMRETVQDALDFINDHRYDPTEIYGEDMYEEFKNIPDPTADPKRILHQFIAVLDELGPYAADKAAFALLTKLEKLKIKVPYERHFLLLCLCTSVFVKIRSYSDYIFSKYDSDWKKIEVFSTPKVMRFAEILEKFQPPEQSEKSIENDTVGVDANVDINDGNVDTIDDNVSADTEVSNVKTGEANDTHNDNVESIKANSTVVDINDKIVDTKVESVKIADEMIENESKTNEMLKTIEKCDFITLGNKIEDRVNTYESNLKDLYDVAQKDIQNEENVQQNVKTRNECALNQLQDAQIENKDAQNQSKDAKIEAEDAQDISSVNEEKVVVQNEDIYTQSGQADFRNTDLFKGVLGLRRPTRNRGRSRVPRNNTARMLQMQQNPDALCAIVFLRDCLLAKIMFLVVVDMSRCNPRLNYLCAQFCGIESDAQDPKESQRQGKKQEEVLKKFRMHECNILLATPALEEGIDLPRCNLVLRWDLPTSYRSYGLCRSRARAPRAACAVLCSSSGQLVKNVAVYRELDQVVSRKCGCGIQDEPSQDEENHADSFTNVINAYTPQSNGVAESCHKTLKSVEKSRNLENESVDSCFMSGDITADKSLLSITIENTVDKSCMSIDETVDKSSISEDISQTNDEPRETSGEKSRDGKLRKDVEKRKESDGKSGLNVDKCGNNDEVNASDEKSPTTIDNDCKNNTKVRESKRSKEKTDEVASVDLSTAISLINRYCAKLPSDTFTRLAPQWWMEQVRLPTETGDRDAYICTLRLPLNCPVKYNIVGHPMPTRSLARRMVALQACRILHRSGELDDQLMPIGKENFKAAELDSTSSTTLGTINSTNGTNINDNDCARPGTTKRRQYYYKRTAWAFTDCQPVIDTKDSELEHKESIDKVGEGIDIERNLEERSAKTEGMDHIEKEEVEREPIVKDDFTTLTEEEIDLKEKGDVLECVKITKNDIKTQKVPDTNQEKLTEEKYDLRKEISEVNEKQEKAKEIKTEQDTVKNKIKEDNSAELPKEKTPFCDSDTKAESETSGKRNMLYAIVCRLWCALPERYNTRGRRLHAPQHARQGMGVLIHRHNADSLQIPAFPVYTRSGEVRVSIEYVPDADVRVTKRRDEMVRRFMSFVFSDVLRVRRRGMKLQAEGITKNNYYIVPTIKTSLPDGSTKIDIDWPFLEVIYQHTETPNVDVDKPVPWQEQDGGCGEHVKESQEEKTEKSVRNPLLKEGETFVFNADKYREAVVTPWYRNQDQPQFFLVAEICSNLTPDSAFPSATHTTFRHYYSAKYGVTLTQCDQPLLDVDHTSARLNLLTPRYVNRKGVALPVSSERTRRAKRDRLDQKQILVPELCRVHPFAAPLWFATVALPCVLYRINALLIADEIRRSVAIDVGVGIPKIQDPHFQWPALDFGWSLAEVLSADAEKNDKKKDDSFRNEHFQEKEGEIEENAREWQEEKTAQENRQERTLNDILQEAHDNSFEIGTWTNEMAATISDSLEYDEYSEPLPPNLTFCTSASGGANWCDPIKKPVNQFNPSKSYSMADSDYSYMSSDFDTDDSEMSDCSEDADDTSGFGSGKDSYASMGVRIEYKTAHEAEAVDLERQKINPAPQGDEADDDLDRRLCEEFIREGQAPVQYIEKFHESVENHRKTIIESGCLIYHNDPLPELLPETKESLEKHETYKRSKNVQQNYKESSINDERQDTDRICKNNDELIENTDELSSKTDKLRENTSSLSEKADGLRISTVRSVRFDEQSIKQVKTDYSSIKTEIVENDGLSKKIVDNYELNKKLTSVIINNDGQVMKNAETCDEIPKDAIKIEKDAVNHQYLETIDLKTDSTAPDQTKIKEIFPYGSEDIKLLKNGQIDLESIEKNKRKLLEVLKNSLSEEEIQKLNCFSMIDVDIDSPNYVNEKVVNVGFDAKETYVKKVNTWGKEMVYTPYYEDGKGQKFDFDYQPNLEGHPGPSPSVILQALTMSNANDGINLERLETIGDSFLKFAITAYLYCAHPTVHEGKLSHMRSKQVSNLNLYRLGRNKRLGARMIASKFEPHDNWLPPCHKPPNTLHHRQDDSEHIPKQDPLQDTTGCFIPYNLITQHSIPDKSIADCVEALIGAYLLECGPRGALLFMSWLGIKVLPRHDVPLDENHPYVVREREKETQHTRIRKPSTPQGPRQDSESQSSDDEGDIGEEYPKEDWSWPGRPVGSLRPLKMSDGTFVQPIFGCLKAPPSPLLRYIADPDGELNRMLSGYDALEERLQYRFKDRSLLLQAFSHASHQPNRLTDCYQRLEFLGDAILDYLITRHLYLDPRRHSPGALTDLRSALVNNTIFATLAARHGFHKYFRHLSPGLNEVLTKYVKIQEENGHSISEEHYLIQEDELEQAEDVEVPKALGDLFESVAGAIFLDSGMSLQAVWKSYELLMGAELELFSAAAPKSPVRELLEAEPDTAKFGKPERLADGRRVRVCVEVFGRGAFKGVGRNYRIAKGTAARCALRHLKIHRTR